MIENIYFFMSLLCILIGHIFRVARWRIFLQNIGIEVTNTKPFVSLVCGYFVNFVLPFRMGELVRSVLLAQSARLKLADVLSTVIYERVNDAVILILLFLIFFYDHDFDIIMPLATFSSFIIICSYLTIYNNHFRRYVYHITRIFNRQIAFGMLRLLWNLSNFVHSSKNLFNIRLITTAIGMWVFYILSVFFLAISIDLDFNTVLKNIYYTNVSSVYFLDVLRFDNNWLYVFSYFVIPLIIVITYLSFRNNSSIVILRLLLRKLMSPSYTAENNRYSSVLTFNTDQLYYDFLRRKFNGKLGVLDRFESYIGAQATIMQVFNGGSGAITALISENSEMKVRKYSYGATAKKLLIQSNWLERNKSKLPVVTTFNKQEADDMAAYDMPWLPNASGFYERIHSSPLDTSLKVLGDVLLKILEFHNLTEKDGANKSVLKHYINEKVFKNIEFIEMHYGDLISKTILYVNGTPINNNIWAQFKNLEWLEEQFSNVKQAEIHGDLTIENILVKHSDFDNTNWFLIDPNPDNIFDSPFIDYAKLAQSLHFGYEYLNRNPIATFDGTSITFNQSSSFQYSVLYSELENFIKKNFGEEGLRQMYLHEIVNYFRLLPYQIKRDQSRGLAFLGVLSLLMENYNNRYGK